MLKALKVHALQRNTRTELWKMHVQRSGNWDFDIKKIFKIKGIE